MRDPASQKLGAYVGWLAAATGRSARGYSAGLHPGPADHAAAGVRSDVLVADRRRRSTRSPPIHS
jgi:hypothetical protein